MRAVKVPLVPLARRKSAPRSSDLRVIGEDFADLVPVPAGLDRVRELGCGGRSGARAEPEQHEREGNGGLAEQHRGLHAHEPPSRPALKRNRQRRPQLRYKPVEPGQHVVKQAIGTD